MRPIASHFSFLPPRPPPHQIGRHMCTIPNLNCLWRKKLDPTNLFICHLLIILFISSKRMIKILPKVLPTSKKASIKN